MRYLVPTLLTMCLFVAFIPGATAETPNLLWPPEELMGRSDAQNLSVWFANRLGFEVDDSRPGSWHQVDEPNRPDFLRSDEAFILPLVGGEIEVKYLDGGVPRSIVLTGNTSYVAESTEDAPLRATIDAIADDLGLNASGSELNIGIAIYPPMTPEWHVELVRNPVVGTATFFNSLSIVVRASDLRVISVVAEVWYDLPDDVDARANDATEIAEEHARSEHGAVGPNGTVIGVAVSNQTGLAFHIFTSWSADPEADWTLETWVDGTTGEILFEEGPSLTTEDTVPPPGGMPWIPAIIIIALVVLVTLSLFYRLTTERALDHFTRGRILGYIQANPGSSYTSVREALSLTIGTFAYHLWVLERLGFVKSIRQGRVKLLHPRGRPITQRSLVLSELQFAILDLLSVEGDLSQTEISRRFGISRQRVHYNIKKLCALSMIEVEEGGKVRLSTEGTDFIEEERNARGGRANTSHSSKA